ncbi:MAG: hypothetical protein NTZ87_03700 [Candidatus Nomurabacteria bacterium]|nr:hypothetical protein [Candidatus Nomurabacteria bacterium]
MDDTVDLLKIKIEKAKRELPLETANAIDAIDWKTAVLELRSKYGYTFEQLGDLELETELLLCGLVSGKDYPKELENRLKISKMAANELVNEMNDLVFKKIREELIKNIERKKTFVKIEKNDVNDMKVLSSVGIEIVPEKLEIVGGEKPAENREDILKKIENPEPVQTILAQKLSGTVQIPAVKTDHSLENITKAGSTPLPQAPKAYPKNADPYRLAPE